jgi:predicted nucleic acid-binding protein
LADFSFDGARRCARFAPTSTLARRDDDQLPFVHEERIAGQAMLLDTCVYIDQMQNRTPAILDDLVEARQINHSTVALQELMHTVGVLDPRDVRTAGVIEAIRGQVRAIPSHRLFTADADVLGRAALLAGILCRVQGYAGDNKLRLLHDCVLFLQAQKHGLTVLTANVGDFDFLLQLIPSGRALFYRKS